MELLSPHTGTIVWMLIAFLLVFFILKKFAWKPLLNALKMREESIANALQSAEIAKKEMETLKADNEKILTEARLERDKIIAEGKELKDNIISQAKEKASEEANKIFEDSRKAISAEKESAIKEIKEHIAELSVNIAEKLLREKLTSDKDHKRLIDRLLRDAHLN
jgi:F-type H+-transporting ATPase subunit b